MAEGLYIDARQLQKGAAAFRQIVQTMPDRVSDILKASATAVVRDAKRNAPADRGSIGKGISFDDSKPLQKVIKSEAPYSAYMEFGTGKYAAEYVASLPGDYQSWAGTFRGKSGMGGGFYEFALAILAWIKRKGIVSNEATYSVKSRRRTGSKAAKFEQDLRLAEAIAFSILKNGVHPHPFLLPAFFDRQPKLVQDMMNLLKKLKP